MKVPTAKELLFFLLAFICISSLSQAETTDRARIKKNIDFDWYFHLGDIPDGQSTNLSIEGWRKLDIPHDWSIEGNYTDDFPGAKRVGFLKGGIGWYMKTIQLDKSWKDKKVSVEFDGVYMNSKVWINGHYLGVRPYGYIGFAYDLTPYLQDGDNVIAVRVDNSKSPSGRWYTGSGIYRHVNLVITDRVHVARNGVFIQTPEVSKEKASVHAEIEIKNEGGKQVKVNVISAIQNKEGKEILSRNNEALLDPDTTVRLGQDFTINQPRLWDPDSPNVYYLKTVIKKGKKVLDTRSTRFGIRKIEVSPDFGFKLNGRSLKLKGMADHQNTGAVGIALPEDMLYHRLKMYKEMGCNAIRATCYPFAPEFYAMCDTMGFMVMDDAFDGWDAPKADQDYGRYWDQWWRKDVEEFIKANRNYPSIVIWCMGNEVKPNPKDQLYSGLQEQIYKAFRELDTTRPITQAYARGNYLDIAGFNGDGEHKHLIPEFHKTHPQMPIVGTEMPHTRQSRGIYRTITSYHKWNEPAWFEKSEDKKKAYLTTEVDPIPDLTEKEVFTGVDLRYASSYDNQTLNMSVRDAWKQVLKYDYFMGEFRWTGFDYLGEAWSWPSRTNNYGIIDLAGFPKDAYYLYQSMWTDKPMIHILPHWTHPGKEGITIPIVAYSNCDAAELFLNGKSLGKRKMDKDTLQIVWKVPYAPGILKAVAYRGDQAIAKDSSITAGPDAGIRLIADRKSIRANRRDVVQIEVDITDEKGNFAPTANDTVHFEVTGPYQLLGVENGDILDMSPHKVLWRKTYMGKALLVLQATDRPGPIQVKAKGIGLKPTEISISAY